MIEEYLKQHNLNSKEDIAKHVEELKRNTFPNIELISSLCSYLFSGEKSASTRHKSRNGETHLEFPMLKISKDVEDCFNNQITNSSILGGTTLNDTAKKQLLELNKGVKTNKSKPQMSLLFKQFPKALEAIVKCSEYGNTKYKETDSDFLNFQRVEGGSKTYADAGLRHRLEQGNDSESGLPHQYHVAWNAIAELQIWIMENER